MMLWAKNRLTKYGDAFISGADPVHAFNCIPGGGDRDDDDGEGGNDDANCKQFGQFVRFNSWSPLRAKY